MRKEIVDHLERNEIISDVQHGFVQGKSCKTKLLTVIEEWTKWIEESKPFDCLYFDYVQESLRFGATHQTDEED